MAQSVERGAYSCQRLCLFRRKSNRRIIRNAKVEGSKPPRTILYNSFNLGYYFPFICRSGYDKNMATIRVVIRMYILFDNLAEWLRRWT